VDTGITPAPTGLGLEFGPRMMVVPAQPGTTTVDLYRQFISAPESCPAHQPTVAIVRTGVLNSPDQVALRSSQRRGATFTLELEIRRFDGPLAGNDPWVALIQVDLGALDPGSYQLVAQETVLRFTDLHHPERATDPASREQRMSFDCR
jgi:hypothetical protein